MTPLRLTASQRAHLVRLATAGGRAAVLRACGWHRAVLDALATHGLVVVHPGGSTSRCPRTGIGVFTPGVATVEITEAGRVLATNGG
mgnify:CR=1 FL=1